MSEFRAGDLVYHLSINDESDERKLVGRITGFCPSDKWIRVKAIDGGSHIWLKENVCNIDAEERLGVQF